MQTHRQPSGAVTHRWDQTFGRALSVAWLCICAGFGITICPVSVAAQTPGLPSGRQAPKQHGPAPPRFRDYEFTQYITATDLAPSNILRLDNNGEIVLAARRGITRSQLDDLGITFSESQITLLETFRLLDEKGDTLRTAFPILGAEETRRLREHVRDVAPAFARRLEPKVRRFREELGRNGREENAYSIMFSYVLDGLVWNEFEKLGILNGRAITAERPLWSGYVWALYPPRSFSPGTNSISEQGVALKVTWTRDAIPRMHPFVSDFPTLDRLVDDYGEKGLVEDRRAREVFGPFGLFDKSGHVTVPVIDESASNALYRSARAIAQDAAEQAPRLLDLSGLAAAFDFRDEQQALVVSYHELMWDVMDQLEALGLVQKPIAFAKPEQSRPADIAALVFIVRSSR